MIQTKERIQVRDDHTVFKIMPGVNCMAVRAIEEGKHHNGAHNYDYDITPQKGQRLSQHVCVRATIQQSDSSPYIMRDMIFQRRSGERKAFGRVVINHNLRRDEAGFVPEAGKVHYFDYETQTSYFGFEGSLVKEDNDGVRQLVEDGARFDDGAGMSVAIDASGIAVTMSGENFADIPFDQSHVSMAVANIDDGVYTYSKELYFC